MSSRTLASLLRLLIGSLLVAVVAGCGGGGGGGGGGASTYRVGGTVSGLTGSGLVLRLNGGNDLAVSANGPFTFVDGLTEGRSFAVTVASQPEGQTCAVEAGTGTVAAADVNDVVVSCTYRLMGGAVQGKALHLTGAVTTLVGTPLTYFDGTGTGARFRTLNGGTTDGTSLYVIDRNTTTTQILRRVSLATGAVTTLDTSLPADVRRMVAAGGNLYLTHGRAVSRVSLGDGSVTLLAGVADTAGTVDGTGTDARFMWPDAIASDGTYLYVSDSIRVRRIEIATQVVTTLAGNGSSGETDATPGTAASFNGITGLVLLNGSLYVAEGGINKTIRRIDLATTAVTTFSGSGVVGTVDGNATEASFGYPTAITTDGTSLYVTEDGNYTVRAIDASGTVTTLAGAGTQGYVNGVGTAARFGNRRDAVVADGKLYLFEQHYTGEGVIRQLDPATKAVTTIAGVGPGADGTGVAVSIRPDKVTTDGTHLYVADGENSTIRKVVIATGEVSTLAGTATVRGHQDGTGAAARFGYPAGITTDGTHLYVGDCDKHNIRQVVIATGEVTTLAGEAGTAGLVNGTGTAARFNCPYGVTTDGTHLYVADGRNNAIRKVVIATGEVTTLAGGVEGYLDGTGTAAQFSWPEGITTDGVNLYVVEDSQTVRKIVIATGEVTTLAGQAWVFGNTDDIGTAATFLYPYDITTDGTHLYVAQGDGHNIRRVEIATGAVTTLAGPSTNEWGFADGTGAAARFEYLYGITTDGESLFVSDFNNTALRVIK